MSTNGMSLHCAQLRLSTWPTKGARYQPTLMHVHKLSPAHVQSKTRTHTHTHTPHTLRHNHAMAKEAL